MVDVISQSDVLDHMHDELIQTAFTEGFLEEEHLSFDATHFEARDAAKPSEKKEIAPKKRGRKSKEERATWLAEQAEIETNQTTYEKNLDAQRTIPLNTLWQDIPLEPKWGIKKNSDGKNTF